MKIFKGVPLWALIFGLLLFANLGWISWIRCFNDDLRSGAKQFKLVHFHTNDVAGIGIVEKITGKPLWIEWDFNHDGKPDEESYFYQGTNVFNLHLSQGQRPKYDVIFYGAGKSQVWWWDKGNGSFTERISYDTNGNRSGFEVWYDKAWHSVVRQNKKNGVMLNGQWNELWVDTNGLWTMELSTNASAK